MQPVRTRSAFSPTNFRSGVTRTGGSRHRMGMEAADGELYRKYADDLTRFATGLVGPSNGADIVSEAVLSCLGSHPADSSTSISGQRTMNRFPRAVPSPLAGGGGRRHHPVIVTHQAL